MKQHTRTSLKRSLAVVMSLLMLMSAWVFVAPETLPQASAAVTQESDLPTFTFYVPETIYLNPSDNKTFQYYVDRAQSVNGSLTASSGDTSAWYYFKCDTATSVSSLTCGASNPSLSVTSSTSGELKGIISGGALSSAISMNSTTLVPWTVTFTTAKGTFTATAYSVAYAPNRNVTANGATGFDYNSDESFASSLIYIQGAQTTAPGSWTGESSSEHYTLYQNINQNTSGDNNTQKLDPLVNGITNGVKSCNPNAYGSSSSTFTGATNSFTSCRCVRNDEYDGDGQWVVHVECNRTPAEVIVDTSRYSNTSQVPNLKLGFIVTDRDHTSKRRNAYVADCTSQVSNANNLSSATMNYTANYNGSSTTVDLLKHSRWRKDDFSKGVYSKVGTVLWGTSGCGDDTDTTIGQKYNSSINYAVSGSGATTYRYFRGGACGAKSSSWAMSTVLVILKVTTVTKADLRSLVNECVGKYMQAYYPIGWSNYNSALQAAALVLGNPAATQSQIDTAVTNLTNAKNALVFPLPLTLDADTIGDLPAGGEIWFSYKPTSTKNYVFFTHADYDTMYELYEDPEGDSIQSQDDGDYYIRQTLGLGYQVYDELTLTAGTTYYFKVHAYDASSGETPVRIATPVAITFDATGGTSKTYNLPKGYGTMKFSNTGVKRTGHQLVAWSTQGTGPETKTYLPSASISVPGSAKTYYALWRPTNAPVLTVNSTNTATISAPSEIDFYQFTPEETRTYVLYSTSTSTKPDSTDLKLDPYVLIYDASTYPSTGEYLYTDDDGGNSHHEFVGDANRNFYIEKELTAGTTYLIGVKAYHNSTRDGDDVTGSYPFRFETVYSVDYDANGGDEAPTTVESKYFNKELTLSVDVPFLENYDFLGWATTDDATEAEYQPGDAFNVNADTTLYAVWKLCSYDVTLSTPDDCGYTVTTYPTATVDHGGSVTFTITLDEGYTDSAAPTVTATNGTVGTPVKNGDDISYTVSNITGDTVITVASATPNKYSVTFVDDDGTTVLKETVAYDYGTAAADIAKPDDPMKAATAQYTYTFTGWSPEITDVTGDVTYTATYSSTLRKYNVTFVDEDGTTVLKDAVAYNYGTAAADIAKPNDPAKAATAQYTYTFSGWSPAITDVTGDVTYTATYSSTVNKYSVTFVDEDGTTVLKEATLYDYGTAAADIAKPDNPTKAATAQYTYTFAGWTPEVVAVTGDATYVAQFSENLRSYTVTWMNGETEIYHETLTYGATPSYNASEYGTPEKAADAQYTYAFAGWSPEVAAVTGDATYKANFTGTKNSYTITWLNDDDSLIDTTTVEYGVVPTHAAASKAATAEYTYTFAGWSPEVVAVTGDATYKANFTGTKNSYTITWLNDDDSLIDTTTVEYGVMPTHADASKAATAEYTYTFAGWTPEVVAVTGDATYKANFTGTKNSYTITWLNDDDSVIDTTTVEYGVVPTHADASKAATAEYTYTFAGWSPEVVAVTGDATYKANFTGTKNSYTITWLNDDDSLIDTTSVEYGDMPTHADASKAATAEYTYTFAGWSPEAVAVTGDATYKANFTSTKNSYTITWLNDDDSLIDTATVEYGVVPTHADASKAATAQYTYTFTGWSPEVVAVTGDATYTATYSSTVRSYTVKFFGLDGETVLSEQTIEYGSAATAPELPEKAPDSDYHYAVAWNSDAWQNVTGLTEITAVATPTTHIYTGTPTWGAWTDENTITAAFTCDDCAYVKTVNGEVATDPHTATCTEDAYTVYTATVTNDAGTEFTSAPKTVTDTNTAHHTLTFIPAQSAADCTVTGKVAHWHCTVCLKNFTDDTAATELTDLSDNTYGDHDYSGAPVYVAPSYNPATGAYTDGSNTWTCLNEASHVKKVVAVEAADYTTYQAAYDAMQAMPDGNPELTTEAQNDINNANAALAAISLNYSEAQQSDLDTVVDTLQTQVSDLQNEIFEADGTTIKDSALKHYDVTFTAQSGDVTSFNKAKGAVIDIPAVPAQIDGCPFQGWTFDGETIVIAPNETTYTVTGAAAFTAKYAETPISCTVTFFDKDGVQIGEAQTVSYGESVTAPVLPDAWYDAANHYTYAWSSNAYTFVTGDLEITVVETSAAHEWVDGEVTLAATCMSTGTQAQSCACGATGEKTLLIDPTNHTGHNTTTVENEVSATCSTPGSYDEVVTCECGAEISRTEKTTPTAAHRFTHYTYNNDATCTADGTETAFCDFDCGTTDTRTKAGTATGHVWGEWTVTSEATCSAEGVETRVCQNDSSHTQTRTTPKLSHVDGNGDNVCDNCGATLDVGFRCSLCNKNDHIQASNQPGIVKVFYDIIHFVVHTFQSFSYFLKPAKDVL